MKRSRKRTILILTVQLFQDLNDEGRTIIMITHDLSIAKYAHRIVDILDGELAEGGASKVRHIKITQMAGTTVSKGDVLATL